MSLRFFLIYASLFCVLGAICLFLSGPLWTLGLDNERGEHLQLIQIVIPTFLSYLAAAVTYATSTTSFREPTGEKGKILKVITVASVMIFIIGVVLSTVIFRYAASENSGIPSVSFSQYSSTISVLLGVLSATTASVSAHVFSSSSQSTSEQLRS